MKHGMFTYSVGVQINLEVILHLFVLSPDQLLSVSDQGFAELGSEVRSQQNICLMSGATYRSNGGTVSLLIITILPLKPCSLKLSIV